MTTPAAMDPWANTDHDPLSHTEQSTAHTATELHQAHAISGAALAQYPDFPPGAPVRVLPAIVSNAVPTDRRAFRPGAADAGGALDAEPTCGGLSVGTHYLPVSEVPDPTDRKPVAVNPRP